MKTQRGFTLIELLVVIAIIGIFSAVAVAAMNSPRDRGGDASVKANLRTIQNQAQLFLDSNNGRYNTDGAASVTAGSSCPPTGNTMFAADPVIKNAIQAASSAGGSGSAKCYMNSTGTRFVVWARLKTGQYWCIDQTGAIKPEPADMTNLNTSCP